MDNLGLPSYAGEATLPYGQFENPQPAHLPFGRSLSARFGSPNITTPEGIRICWPYRPNPSPYLAAAARRVISSRFSPRLGRVLRLSALVHCPVGFAPRRQRDGSTPL